MREIERAAEAEEMVRIVGFASRRRRRRGFAAAPSISVSSQV